MGINSERLAEFANAQQEIAQGRVLGKYLSIQRAQEAGAPEFITKNSREQYVESLGNFASLCNYLGKGPQETLLSFLRTVVEDVTKGEEVYLGSYIHPATHEQTSAIVTFIEDTEKGETFAKVNMEPRAQVETKLRRNIEELHAIPDTLGVLSSLEEHEIAQDISFSLRIGETVFTELPAKYYAKLSIPLIPGRSLSITISPYNPERIPQHEEEFFSEAFPMTYPADNLLATPPGSRRSSEKIIKIQYPPEIPIPIRVQSSYKFDVLFGSMEGARLTPELHERARMLLDRELDDIHPKEASTVEVLYAIYAFVGEANDSVDREDDKETDFETLLTELEETGKFDGDCKAASTLVAGFCETLGFSTRTLQGFVTHTKDGSGAGHMWTEAYIPSLDQYVPVDPAGGAFGTYPKPEEMVYHAHGFILEDQRARKNISLTVTTEDFHLRLS